jgi:uncharacterized protein YegL
MPVLKRLSDIVVQIDNVEPESITSFFKWVSVSVSSNSQKIMSSGDNALTFKELPPLPKEIQLVM